MKADSLASPRTILLTVLEKNAGAGRLDILAVARRRGMERRQTDSSFCVTEGEKDFRGRGKKPRVQESMLRLWERGWKGRKGKGLHF